MFSMTLGFFFACLILHVASEENTTHRPFREEKEHHVPSSLNKTQMLTLSRLTNETHMNAVLDEICIPRVVGTANHTKVKTYLKAELRSLGWTVESDIFNATTPNVTVQGDVFPAKTLNSSFREFENIIARLNPNARRYLVLSCHYDSMYTKDGKFVGATDSAVPCAQLLNLATVMKKYLESAKTSDLSLMLIFFDGEEAFRKWGRYDSLYGSRHLAQKWHEMKSTYGTETDISELDKIDLFLLLDLLGTSRPRFYNYFDNTRSLYSKIVEAENTLYSLNEFTNPGPMNYFRSSPSTMDWGVQDDHLPFLRKNVRVIHVIPYNRPFPAYWHTNNDNRSIIDMNETENLNKIFRVFVASYLNLNV